MWLCLLNRLTKAIMWRMIQNIKPQFVLTATKKTSERAEVFLFAAVAFIERETRNDLLMFFFTCFEFAYYNRSGR